MDFGSRFRAVLSLSANAFCHRRASAECETLPPICEEIFVELVNSMVYAFMMTEVLNQQSHAVFSLSSLREVWAFELSDIDDRLSGNDPDSFSNWLGEQHKNIESKTGVEKSLQFGLIGMIPGVRNVAMAGAAVGLGVDLFNNLDTVKKADRTQRLLALSEEPELVPNWDTVEMLIEHIDTWLLPVLNRRNEVLQQVNLASGGNQTVTDRLTLYESGIGELNAALIWLRLKEGKFKQAYKSLESVYVDGANTARKVYGEAKKAVNLSVDALLMDRTSGNEKLEEIERSYAKLRCNHGGVLSRCENLRVEGGDFCLTHTCSNSACSKSVAKSSHYCSEHGKQLQDVNAFMPKLLAQNGLLPKEKTDESPGKNGTLQTVIFCLAALVLVMFLGDAFTESRKASETPAPARVVSAVQPLVIQSNLGIENFANLTSDQLESRRLEIEQQGELAGKKYDSYDEKVNILKPRIKVGDRDQIVANAKEVMATMESRLTELRAINDAVEKLIQIYKFIESNPSKLAAGTTLATNTERLRNMQDASQKFRKAVTDAESQNASSRSALAEIIAAR